MNTLKAFIPIALTLPSVLLVLWICNRLLLGGHFKLGIERKFPRQLLMMGLSIAGIIAIAMALPVGVSTRNQVIAFLGLVVSGIVAFSSTTVFANLMAGLMMRTTRPFRAGDFIRVNDVFGRVSERGLLDTEIQTETRELISIPNTYLITHPVSVIRSSGTIISVSLSLGYDVHHAVVTPLLEKAARESGLEEPFVHIAQLGDFSITYKVNGLLVDVKSLLTARSNLYRNVLNSLHRAGIEIVSPNFMNQRPLKEDQVFIPDPMYQQSLSKDAKAEKLAFDKADEAERKEMQRIELQKVIEALEATAGEADEEQRRGFEKQLQEKRALLEKLDAEEE
jgi:small-conductance mechanosensitive channel